VSRATALFEHIARSSSSDDDLVFENNAVFPTDDMIVIWVQGL